MLSFFIQTTDVIKCCMKTLLWLPFDNCYKLGPIPFHPWIWTLVLTKNPSQFIICENFPVN